MDEQYGERVLVTAQSPDLGMENVGPDVCEFITNKRLLWLWRALSSQNPTEIYEEIYRNLFTTGDEEVIEEVKENLQTELSGNLLYSATVFTFICEELSSPAISSRERLLANLVVSCETGRPFRIVVFACMPKLQLRIIENSIPNFYYEYDRNQRVNVDFARNGLIALVTLLGKTGVSVKMEIILADTEVEQCYPLEYVDLAARDVVAPQLKARLQDSFGVTADVVLESTKLPGGSNVYSQGQELLKQYLSLYGQQGLQNPRIRNRVWTFTTSGMEERLAMSLAIRQCAYQDWVYAIEGQWLAENCEVLVIVDGYGANPEGYWEKHTALIGQDKLPALYPER